MEFSLTDPAFAGKLFWLIGLITWEAIRYRPNRTSRKNKISVTARSPVEIFSMIVSFSGLGIIPLIWIFSGEVSSFNHTTNWVVTIIGIILFTWSLYLFRVTHKALGAMWSVSLDLREGHKLVTSGIYEKVRHPMYSAFWLWAVAQPFLLSNWIAGFSGIVGFGILFFLRVGREEAMMEGEFGDQYRDYSQRTKRIIPNIY